MVEFSAVRQFPRKLEGFFLKNSVSPIIEVCGFQEAILRIAPDLLKISSHFPQLTPQNPPEFEW